MGLFSKKQQPKQEAWIADSTTEQQEGNGLTSRECRGCNNGNGDGNGEYHANLFRRSLQRQDKIYSNRPRY